MDAKRVETARRFSDLIWVERDVDAAWKLADTELEIDWATSESPYVGVYTGLEGLREFSRSIWEAWEEFVPEIAEVIDCGDGRFIAVYRVRARGRTSGIEVGSGGAVLWVFRDQKIIGMKLFQTREHALEAAPATP